MVGFVRVELTNLIGTASYQHQRRFPMISYYTLQYLKQLGRCLFGSVTSIDSIDSIGRGLRKIRV